MYTIGLYFCIYSVYILMLVKFVEIFLDFIVNVQDILNILMLQLQIKSIGRLLSSSVYSGANFDWIYSNFLFLPLIHFQQKQQIISFGFILNDFVLLRLLFFIFMRLSFFFKNLIFFIREISQLGNFFNNYALGLQI